MTQQRNAGKEWCEKFASELLIPEDILKKEIPEYILKKEKNLTNAETVSETVEKLAKKFRVSKLAMLTRYRTLNLITQQMFEEESHKLEEKKLEEKRQKKGGFQQPAYKKCLQDKNYNTVKKKRNYNFCRSYRLFIFEIE